MAPTGAETVDPPEHPACRRRRDLIKMSALSTPGCSSGWVRNPQDSWGDPTAVDRCGGRYVDLEIVASSQHSTGNSDGSPAVRGKCPAAVRTSVPMICRRLRDEFRKHPGVQHEGVAAHIQIFDERDDRLHLVGGVAHNVVSSIGPPRSQPRSAPQRIAVNSRYPASFNA